MKMNWGYRIALLYAAFVVLIGFFVVRSMGEKIDLVSDDYYADELKYQDKIDNIQRTENLDQQLQVLKTQEGIVLKFPESMKTEQIQGNVLLFRPSKQALDRNFNLAPDYQNRQLIPWKMLVRGAYRLKVDYTYLGATYYFERELYVE